MHTHREHYIRTTHSALDSETSHLGNVQSAVKRQRLFSTLLNNRNRRRTIRYSLLGVNLVLLGIVVAFVTMQTPATNKQQVAQSTLVNANEVTNPLDELSSADIAVNVAKVTKLPEATSVTNLADTVNAQLAVASANNTIIAKPQVIATGLKSRRDIKIYVVQRGDTLASIAAKFDISSDTIRNSNNLDGDGVRPGAKLVISPVNGIVYVVKAGDTIDGLASRYRANRAQLVTFNDLESGRLPVGQRIVIPDGRPPSAAGAIIVGTPGGSAAAGVPGTFTPSFGYNGYDFGYCTWWAATRRAQIGRPIPANLGNASTWKILAQRAGFAVGSVPQKGAVIWTPPRDYYGHVGFVEDVLPDGRVVISEMNVAGWNRVSRRTMSPGEAAGYGYIY